MRPGRSRWRSPTATVAGLTLLATALTVSPAAAQLAVRGGTVHTVAGEAIPDGVVLVGADGRIERVGPASSVEVPAGYRVLEAVVVTPGLVDARTVVGLSGILGGDIDQDHLERSSAIQPELRAFDAYNAREPLVEWVRNLGTTTLHTGHGPGALVSGQTMVVKSRGVTVDAALVDSVTTLAGTLGPEVSQALNGRPGTRSRGVAMLRAYLLRAQERQARAARETEGGAPEGGRAGGGAAGQQDTRPPEPDLGLQTMERVLRGEVPLMITANRVPEIMAALRLQREFGFRLILDSAAEAYLVLDEIREAGVPVILHPTMARHQGPLENATFGTAARLADAGIPFAIPSGYEPYFPKTRVLLMEAAVAAGYGLPRERTLAAITLDAARILGVDARVGSLEPGKDGDLVLFDGDPFEYTTHVCAVVIEGEVVSEECR